MSIRPKTYNTLQRSEHKFIRDVIVVKLRFHMCSHRLFTFSFSGLKNDKYTWGESTEVRGNCHLRIDPQAKRPNPDFSTHPERHLVLS